VATLQVISALMAIHVPLEYRHKRGDPLFLFGIQLHRMTSRGGMRRAWVEPGERPEDVLSRLREALDRLKIAVSGHDE
jgi:hypothetical protein